jgi:hypothetical protein
VLSHFILPEGLDMPAVIPHELHRYLDAARWFVHRVTTGTRADTKKRAKHRRGVPIRHVDMARFFRKEGDWTAVRRAIIVAGVVECNERYLAGWDAKQYWLTPEYENRPIVKVPVTDPRFLRKLIAIREESRVTGNWQSHHRNLEAVMSRFTVDEDRCRRLACRSTDKHRRRSAAILRINTGDHRMIVDNRSGRIYSAFTSLPKVIRPYLTCGGQPLVEIDVLNSQALILGVLAALCWNRRLHVNEVIAAGREGDPPTEGELRESGFAYDGEDREDPLSPYVGANPTVVRGIHGSFTNQPGPFTRHIPRWSPVPIQRGRLPEDLLEFIKLCEDGKVLYELAHIWGMPFSSPERYLKYRRKVKKLQFRLYYGPKPLTRGRSEVFAERFPTIARFLARLKTSDHRVVSRVLTRLESELIVDSVCGCLVPDVPLITIHDSLITVPEHEPTVRQSIYDAYARYGVAPTLKTNRDISIAPKDLAALTDPLA